VAEYDKDIKDIKICVRNFDEMITLKANKAEFVQLKVELVASFVHISEMKDLQAASARVLKEYQFERTNRQSDFDAHLL
jgi:hypothetical protein